MTPVPDGIKMCISRARNVMWKVVETQDFYLCMGLCVELSVLASNEN